MPEMDEMTSDAVFAAAETVLARGEPVDLESVRQELEVDDVAGILPRLQEWRVKRALTMSEGESLWDTLVNSLNDLGQDFTAYASALENRLMQEAADRVATITGEAQEAIAEREQRIEELEKFEAAFEELEPKYEQLESDHEEVRTRLDLAEEELQNAQEAMEQAEAHAQEAEQRAREAEESFQIAEQGRMQASEALAETMEARLRADQRIRELDDQLASAEQELEDYRQAQAKAQTEADGHAEVQASEGDWLLGSEDWPELPRQLAVATARLAALRAERDMLKEQKVELKEQLGQAHRLLEIRLSTPTTVVQGGQMPTHSPMSGTGNGQSDGYAGGDFGAAQAQAQEPRPQAPRQQMSQAPARKEASNPVRKVQVIRRRG